MDEKKSAGIGKGTPGPGRGKGNPNKSTKQLKEMILGALEEAGGQTYLLRCAKNPKLAPAFMSLIGRVLPTTLQGPGANGALVFEKIVREIVKPK